MPVWVVFLILGLFQLVIYWVLRAVAKQVSGGRPTARLRFAVNFAGVIGLLILAVAAYAYFAGL